MTLSTRRYAALLATALTLTSSIAVGALTVASPAHAAVAVAAEPVLGSASYLAPASTGFGTAHPTAIFNGGDPAGDASGLAWTGWGERRAYAHGRIPIFRPGGGYYRRPGAIVLRAGHLGTCPDGTRAYTRLWFRVAHRPDGPVGTQWRAWAGDPDICG